MGEENIGVSFDITFLLLDEVSLGACFFYILSITVGFFVLDRIKTITSCTQKNVAPMAFYHGVDSWLSAIREVEAGEIVGFIVVAHESLGTAYP